MRQMSLLERDRETRGKREKQPEKTRKREARPEKTREHLGGKWT